MNDVICFGASITESSATRLRTKRGFRKIGKSESRLPSESPNLQPVFLCERWNDTVQAQVLDKLSVMVGNVPDRDDRDAQFGVRPGIAAFNTVERIVRRERGEDAVRVVEGVLEILNQLGFVFAGSWPPFRSHRAVSGPQIR